MSQALSVLSTIDPIENFSLEINQHALNSSHADIPHTLSLSNDVLSSYQSNFHEGITPSHSLIFNTNDFALDFEVRGLIESGAESAVRSCLEVRTHTIYAFKVLLFSDKALQEVSIWRSISGHDCILPLVAVYDNFVPAGSRLTPFSHPATCCTRVLIIVMPKMQTDLLSHLQSVNAGLGFPEIAVITKQILSALAHMHERGYVHLDVKIENILVEDLPAMKIRLCDFGFTHRVGDLLSRPLYTRAYISPEVVRSMDMERAQLVSPSSDIWAVGITVFIMAKLQLPFQPLYGERDCKNQNVVTENMQRCILACVYPTQGLAPQTASLIAAALQADAAQRPSAASLLALPELKHA